jgi:hypothetical protein
MNTVIIILFVIVGFYLLSKYNQPEKKPRVINKPKKLPVIKQRPKNYRENRDIMSHMIYRAGPFDESIWRYPEQGGKTIKSQAAMVRL